VSAPLPQQPVRLAGERVALRAFGRADEADLVAAFADPQVRAWNPGPEDPAGVARYVAARNDWSAADHASWAVADASDRLVGSVSLHKVDLDQGDAEIGYWTAPWARRRGYAVAAVLTATRWAVTDLGLHRVHLFHAVENLGSCAVARAAGFLLEGTLRQSYRYADGAYHDEHLHAVLAEDLAAPGG
jgi:RimJ/RimL family protein N-acetyltransferase